MPAPWSAAVGLTAFALYLALSPTVSGDQDASELTLALAMGGVPHPTGYPLYAMFGHLFCALLHAFGSSWSFAANAWSALGAGVAIACLHALAARLAPPGSGMSRWLGFTVALIPTALFAINPVWTMSATLAEVHSWHLAWVAGLTLLFLSLAGGLAGREARHDGRGAMAWGFGCGLGLAHHATSVLISMPLTVALVIRAAGAKRWRSSRMWSAIGAALVPLTAYAFVAYRAFHPAAYQWPLLEPSVVGVVRHLAGGGYGHFFGTFAPSELQRGFLASSVYPVLVPGLIAMFVAALTAREGEGFTRWWLLAAALVQTAYVFNYGVPDPAAYFLPAMAIGLLAVPGMLAMLPALRGVRAAVACATVLALLLLAFPWLRVAAERRTGFQVVDQHLRGLWRAIPFERGIVLWPSDMHTRFREYQLFDGEKPNVFVSSPNLLTYERPRRDFERRFGFDPLAGIQIRGEEDMAQVILNVNRQTPLPVVEVDALGLATRTLPKGSSAPR